ncbi:histidine phosphatase family protein [Terrabacter sp. NPDC000476]|uniref:histidine phosphatase family protein n=1 Tax=Terrabacter sp. NPDC000476 TaxID=3154258 RepID=UPI0033249DD0
MGESTSGASGPGARDRTVVHLMRHGEVHNPTGVLYGRLDGFHLSELGREMAELVARHLATNDITHVVASPLERAQETAAPIAAGHDVKVVTDDRVIESANRFEGSAVGARDLLHPRNWHLFRDVRTPSWGEPYEEIATRMLAAIADARTAARGHEAVVVSHQLPVWTVRNKLVGHRLWHDPRRRECTLASLTSLTFEGDDLASVAYSEPAVSLLARASRSVGA